MKPVNLMNEVEKPFGGVGCWRVWAGDVPLHKVLLQRCGRRLGWEMIWPVEKFG